MHVRCGTVGLGIWAGMVTACVVPIDVGQDGGAGTQGSSSSGQVTSSGGSGGAGSSLAGASSGGSGGGASSLGPGSSRGGATSTSGGVSMETTSSRMTLGDGGVTPAAGFDPTYGTQGVVQFQQDIRDFLPQADGTTLVATYSGSVQPHDAGFLVRLGANGALDPSFGTNGVSPLNIAGTPAIHGIALWQAGASTKMLAAVSTFDGSVWSHQAAVATVTAGGATSDVVVLPHPAGVNSAFASAGSGLPDGRWALATQSFVPAGHWVTRGDATGQDTTFGAAGYTNLSANPEARGRAVALWNGRVMVLRDTQVIAPQGNGGQLDLLALGPSGTPDPGFGTNGVVSLCSYTYAAVRTPVAALRADQGGGLLAAVNCNTAGGPVEALLMRFINNGQPDAAFGTQGRVVQAQPGATTTLGALDEDGSGRLVLVGLREVAGTPVTPAQRAYFVTRLLPAGLVDTTLGTNGTITIPDVNAETAPRQMKLDREGRAIININGFTLARVVL